MGTRQLNTTTKGLAAEGLFTAASWQEDQIGVEGQAGEELAGETCCHGRGDQSQSVVASRGKIPDAVIRKASSRALPR